MKIRYAGLSTTIILLSGSALAGPSLTFRAPPVSDNSNSEQGLVTEQEQVVAQAVWPESAGVNGHTHQAIFVHGCITRGDANRVTNSKGGHLVGVEGKAGCQPPRALQGERQSWPNNGGIHI